MNAITQQLIIDGATCASCVARIEKVLKQVDGVETASMNLVDRTAVITGKVNVQLLIDAVENAGYQASLRVDDSEEKLLNDNDNLDKIRYRQHLNYTFIALSVGLPIMLYSVFGGSMSITSNTRLIWLVVGILCLGVIATAGKHFYVNAWKSIKKGNSNMDTLITLGTGTAWCYSMVVVLFPDLFPIMARHVYFEASAMVIGLINLGLALELKARGRTSQAIKRLINLQPKTACVLKNYPKQQDTIQETTQETADLQAQTIETIIPIEQVMVGDIIRIKPGEKIPVDGDIIAGNSQIDESMLTGESMPLAKKSGDSLAAGTLNKTGSLTFVATRVGKDTALAQIIGLVKQAQNSKPAIGRIADKISSYFVPVIVIIALFSALIWWLVGPEPHIIYAIISATTVFIIACPCALGLATPMSIMVGVGKAAEAGVLIRNGEALQTSAKLTVIVLDKTGTITQGSPQLTDIELYNNSERNNVLQLAASLESLSEHPLASAIVKAAQQENIQLLAIDNFLSIGGQGVSGSYAQQQILIGNKKLMQDNLVDISLATNAELLAKQAKTLIYLAINGELLAILAIADPIKTDSIAAIKRLQAKGIKLVMLTGDNNITAKAIADSVNINEFYSEAMPADKSNIIKQIQASGAIVAMVGDGINDAPALAIADVGFAIGTGTDVAIESSDVILMRGSLHGVADAIDVSKATLRNIKQNLTGAFIYNIAGIPIAAGILYPFFGILLSPVIAGAAMAFSSVTVVSNANRLRFLKLDKK